MKMRTGLLIPAAGAMLLLGDCGHGDASGRQHEARLFGGTYMTRNNPYFDVLNEGIEEVAEADDGILLARNPLQDQEKQNEQIQEMINEGIQVLFLNPVDWERAQPALDVCRETRIDIINMSTVVEDRDSITSIIETDNYQANQSCALDMIKRKDEARIVVLGNPIQTSITNREQGFLDTIADNHNYQVVHREAATNEIGVSSRVMADLLHRDIGFDAILRGSDPMALGALAALQQARREEGVLVYGIDGSPDLKTTLDVDYVTETSAQSPGSIEKKAAKTTHRYLDGEPVEKYISTSDIAITRDSPHGFEVDG